MFTRTKKLASFLKSVAKGKSLPLGTVTKGVLRCRFGFTTSKWVRQTFANKLNESLADLTSSIQQPNTVNQTYFSSRSWNIRYIPEKTIFQFSKKDGDYDVKAITYVNTIPEEQKSTSVLQEDSKRLNFWHLNLSIKKEGTEKWFVSQMAVLKKQVSILSLFFTEQEPSFDWLKTTYAGPQISTLPEEVIDGIKTIFDELGITAQLLTNMVIHSSIKVDELNATWLKDLQQVLI